MVEKESSRIDYYMLRIQDLEQALQVHRQPNNIVHHTHPAQPANHPAQTAHFNLPPHQEI
jgi:division protein CdvB (Snf7/Vps24/ESCRT-III family)